VNVASSPSERRAFVARLLQALIDAANPTGGWGYYRGKVSRIEPTSWALLALSEAESQDADAWRRFAAPHVEWVTRHQHADGLLLDYPTAPPSLTANGSAVCMIAHLAKSDSFAASDDVLHRLLGGIVRVKGVSVNTSEGGQDSRLQGWPWMPDTFSWVEPTAWCLLALKKTRLLGVAGSEPRIAEAEKLLLNRSCSVGGWNAGNATAMGQDLRPYVPTTAIGLIGMQDRRADPVVARSLAYLVGAQLSEPSALALALTAVCLRIYGLSPDDVAARLAADAPRAERLGNLHTLAMMLYALTMNDHNAAAFRI